MNANRNKVMVVGGGEGSVCEFIVDGGAAIGAASGV